MATGFAYETNFLSGALDTLALFPPEGVLGPPLPFALGTLPHPSAPPQRRALHGAAGVRYVSR